MCGLDGLSSCGWMYVCLFVFGCGLVKVAVQFCLFNSPLDMLILCWLCMCCMVFSLWLSSCMGSMVSIDVAGCVCVCVCVWVWVCADSDCVAL